jgi:hypothetical protein
VNISWIRLKHGQALARGCFKGVLGSKDISYRQHPRQLSSKRRGSTYRFYAKPDAFAYSTSAFTLPLHLHSLLLKLLRQVQCFCCFLYMCAYIIPVPTPGLTSALTSTTATISPIKQRRRERSFSYPYLAPILSPIPACSRLSLENHPPTSQRKLSALENCRTRP